jgi:hypothetical protein
VLSKWFGDPQQEASHSADLDVEYHVLDASAVTQQTARTPVREVLDQQSDQPLDTRDGIDLHPLLLGLPLQ